MSLSELAQIAVFCSMQIMTQYIIKKMDIIQSSEILEDILLRSQGKKPREASIRLIII